MTASHFVIDKLGEALFNAEAEIARLTARNVELETVVAEEIPALREQVAALAPAENGRDDA